jgi:hypothetical protein
MPVEIYHDEDADVNIVRGKIVAFINYENKGRVQEIRCLSSNDTFVDRKVPRKIVAMFWSFSRRRKELPRFIFSRFIRSIQTSGFLY